MLRERKLFNYVRDTFPQYDKKISFFVKEEHFFFDILTNCEKEKLSLLPDWKTIFCVFNNNNFAQCKQNSNNVKVELRDFDEFFLF